MTNDELAKRFTRGTTTDWTKVQVLYNDGTWALIKHPGGHTGGVFGSHYSPWVVQVNIAKLAKGGMNEALTSKTVWECDRDKDGRLTKKRIGELVGRLKLDSQFIQETTTPKRVRGQMIATKIKGTPVKKRRFRLDTACVQICLFIEGESPPEDWEERLECKTVIVGKIAETGMQINGYYFLLEYDSLNDMLEFHKGDRENILDTLESSS